MQTSTQERLQSQWSGDLNYINRINYYFWLAADAAFKNNPVAWHKALRQIARELSTEMKKNKNIDEKKEIKEKLRGIKKKFNTNPLKPRQGPQMSEQVEEELEDIELQLRGVLKASGLQQKMKEDPGMAL